MAHEIHYKLASDAEAPARGANETHFLLPYRDRVSGKYAVTRWQPLGRYRSTDAALSNAGHG
jgi:hypothetical protein